MSNTTGTHEPTPAFRSALEQEIVRTLRLQTRGRRSRRHAFRSLLQRSWKIAAALIIGVFVGAAPAQVQDTARRNLLLGIAQSEAQVAELHVRIAREALATANSQVATGRIPATAQREAAAALQAAEAKLTTILLNQEEISRTSTGPRDEISAPLVGGRDYVTERLQLLLPVAQSQLALVEEASRTAEVRRGLDLITTLGLKEAQVELEQSRAHLDFLAAKLALRQRFISERLEPSVAERELQLLETRMQLRSAIRMQEIAQERFALVRSQHAVGRVGRAELLKAELEALESTATVEQLTLQLRMLEQRGI